MAGYVIFYEILILSMLQKKRLNNHYNEFIIIIIIYILKIKKLKNYNILYKFYIFNFKSFSR